MPLFSIKTEGDIGIFGRAVAVLKQTVRMEAALTVAADAVGPQAVDLYRGVTPVLTGALRDSTTYAVEHGATVGIVVRQPATNEQGDMYVQWVVGPHRIVAWGHPTGRMYPGNDYPAQVEDQVRRLVVTALDHAGHEAMHGMATDMHEEVK